jgi:hypothetical protein
MPIKTAVKGLALFGTSALTATLSLPMPLPTYNFKWIAPTRYDCCKP